MEADAPLHQQIKNIENTLAAIAERNRKVELEKAWETSKTRVVSILALTYALMCVIFWTIGVHEYLVNAIIPTMGYFLSTQSLPVIKERWLRRYKRG